MHGGSAKVSERFLIIIIMCWWIRGDEYELVLKSAKELKAGQGKEEDKCAE